MSAIKVITDVDELETMTEGTDPTVYVEYDGTFRRASPAQVREGIHLGGLVVSGGQLCIEIEEE